MATFGDLQHLLARAGAENLCGNNEFCARMMELVRVMVTPDGARATSLSGLDPAAALPEPMALIYHELLKMMGPVRAGRPPDLGVLVSLPGTVDNGSEG